MRLAVSPQNSAEMHEREIEMDTAAISIHGGRFTHGSSLKKHSVENRRTKSTKQPGLSTSPKSVSVHSIFLSYIHWKSCYVST